MLYYSFQRKCFTKMFLIYEEIIHFTKVMKHRFLASQEGISRVVQIHIHPLQNITYEEFFYILVLSIFGS